MKMRYFVALLDLSKSASQQNMSSKLFLKSLRPFVISYIFTIYFRTYKQSMI